MAVTAEDVERALGNEVLICSEWYFFHALALIGDSAVEVGRKRIDSYRDLNLEVY